MYIKLFNRILDSSLAENRKLRHFFTDLLLCADADGNVMMTKESISRRIGAPMEEVIWGIEELRKPEEGSLSPDHGGRRIIPLEGHGYGWKIVNFEYYRDLKSSAQLREKVKERVKQWREKHRPRRSRLSPGEAAFIKASKAGDIATCNRLTEPPIRPDVPS